MAPLRISFLGLNYFHYIFVKYDEMIYGRHTVAAVHHFCEIGDDKRPLHAVWRPLIISSYLTRTMSTFSGHLRSSAIPGIFKKKKKKKIREALMRPNWPKLGSLAKTLCSSECLRNLV